MQIHKVIRALGEEIDHENSLLQKDLFSFLNKEEIKEVKQLVDDFKEEKINLKQLASEIKAIETKALLRKEKG